MRTRYCQRCAEEQALSGWDQPRPCYKCGGSQFDDTPPKHSTLLTEDDIIFLRVNRIKPWDADIRFRSW